ncbi:uncharacterized protein LOC126733551 [Anthonomus grandis grandis]|uniref:uncharacterized protein LOC126733551 n=1 Tax=Anthonomus grandis grandis TaxID=2921223 RepID=UPI002165DFD6|nr:uncharacterized protein LOC126733551 [Anthonomus grandis grandis]
MWSIGHKKGPKKVLIIQKFSSRIWTGFSLIYIWIILQKLLDPAIIQEPISTSTLSKLLKKIRFRWTKTEDNRKALMESYDIRLKRIKYLKQILKYKEEGRNTVYTDESYIHSSHTKDKGWFDKSRHGIRKPISKRQRLIILHVGGRNGFVNNAEITDFSLRVKKRRLS